MTGPGPWPARAGTGKHAEKPVTRRSPGPLHACPYPARAARVPRIRWQTTGIRPWRARFS